MALRWIKGLAALGGVLSLLAACGGGGDEPAGAHGGPPQEPPSAPVASPAPTPLLTTPAVPAGLAVSYKARSYAFEWNAVSGATRYELFEDPDGDGWQPPAQVAGELGDPRCELRHDLILHQRIGAKYTVRACNATGCSAHSDAVQPDVLQAIGYFKAGNTDANDRFGSAVAISSDGTTLVIGAPGEASQRPLASDPEDDTQPDAGAAYVFRRKETGWAQEAFLKGNTAGRGDRFGAAAAVSADGRRIVVGAPGWALGRGRVQVFDRGEDGAWRITSELSGSTGGDAFGSSVGLSSDGRTLIVGAPEVQALGGIPGSSQEAGEIPPPLEAVGMALFYRWNGTGWALLGRLLPAVPAAAARFGSSVAVSADGSTLAVGAPGEPSAATGIDGNQQDTSAPGAGAVYVYRAHPMWWEGSAYVKAGNTRAGSGFGASLALSADGNTLAVGAPRDGSDARGVNGSITGYYNRDSGAAYVFGRTGTAWSQQAFVKGNYYTAGDLFASSVSLSADGNMLAVGVPKDSSWGRGFGDTQIQEGGEAGAVHLLGRSASGWSLVVYVKPTNTIGLGGSWFDFGQAVALAADGSAMAVGAPGESGSARGVQGEQSTAARLTRAGAAYLY